MNCKRRQGLIALLTLIRVFVAIFRDLHDLYIVIVNVK